VTTAALIVAAGSSSRLGTGEKKEYRNLNGKSVLLHSIGKFAESGLFQYMCITVPPGGIERVEKIIHSESPALLSRDDLEIKFVEGGAQRQDSVFNGLMCLQPMAPDNVLIHDGARPWITPECIKSVLENTRQYGACVPVLVPQDATKRINKEGFISEHFGRSDTVGVQTPQGFKFSEILEAHEKASADEHTYIDDTEIYHRYIHQVYTIPGDPRNRKITYLHDFGTVQ